jgi:hypothetical protein
VDLDGQSGNRYLDKITSVRVGNYLSLRYHGVMATLNNNDCGQQHTNADTSAVESIIPITDRQGLNSRSTIFESCPRNLDSLYSELLCNAGHTARSVNPR